MTIANFKDMVAAYINRTATSFVTAGGFDILLSAMNDARRMAQREHNFELLRTSDCYLSTSAGGADWTTGCKTTPGGGTAMLMKRLDSVWEYSTGLIGATTTYQPIARVPFDTSGDLKRNLPVVDTNYLQVNQQSSFVTTQFAYNVGVNLYVAGVQSATIYKLFGIKWLDDLTGSESPDLFLTFFTDWFRVATVFCLNTYLKDADRFQIDLISMKKAFESVKQMDGDIANMGEQSNLD